MANPCLLNLIKDYYKKFIISTNNSPPSSSNSVQIGLTIGFPINVDGKVKIDHNGYLQEVNYVQLRLQFSSAKKTFFT